MVKLDDLEKLKKLKDSGMLTDDEFEIEKKKILNQTNCSNNIQETNNNIKEKNKNFDVIQLTKLIIGIALIIFGVSSFFSLIRKF